MNVTKGMAAAFLLAAVLMLVQSARGGPVVGDVHGLSLSGSVGERLAAETALLESGQAAIPLLQTGLADTDRSVARACAQLLGEVRAREAVPSLIRLLQESGDDQLRTAAALSLGEIGDRTATAKLVAILEAPTSPSALRVAAMAAVGRIGDSGALPNLIRFFSQADPILKTYAASAMALLGEPRGRAWLLESAQSKDWRIAAPAIETLGITGGSADLPLLDRLAASRPPALLAQALEAARTQIDLRRQEPAARAADILARLSQPRVTQSVLGACRFEARRLDRPASEALFRQAAQAAPDDTVRSMCSREVRILRAQSASREEGR